MKHLHSILSLCEALEASPSGYHDWQERRLCPSSRALQNQALAKEIKQLQEASRETYGSPRILMELRKKGALSLARISFGSKTLGFCGISRNPGRHDSLADPRASPGRCRTEIPPKLAPRDAGLATPAARAEPELQATKPDAAGPGPLGLAFASLGRMEESAVVGSENLIRPQIIDLQRLAAELSPPISRALARSDAA